KRAPYAVGAVGEAQVRQHAASNIDRSLCAVLKPVTSWEPCGIYVVIALSGLTALGAEVVWTRLLSLLFGATTYAFSIILAVFLIGLGIGSAFGSTIARNIANARVTLGWVQLFLACTIAYGACIAG